MFKIDFRLFFFYYSVVSGILRVGRNTVQMNFIQLILYIYYTLYLYCNKCVSHSLGLVFIYFHFYLFKCVYNTLLGMSWDLRAYHTATAAFTLVICGFVILKAKFIMQYCLGDLYVTSRQPCLATLRFSMLACPSLHGSFTITITSM